MGAQSELDARYSKNPEHERGRRVSWDGCTLLAIWSGDAPLFSNVIAHGLSCRMCSNQPRQPGIAMRNDNSSLLLIQVALMHRIE